MRASKTPWELVLSGAQHVNLERYRELRPGSNAMYDLDQRADIVTRAGFGESPCLISHGVMWSEETKRIALAAEHLLLQNLPALHVGQRATLPFSVKDFTSAQLKSLAGNGMHAAVVATILLWAMSNLAPRSQFQQMITAVDSQGQVDEEDHAASADAKISDGDEGKDEARLDSKGSVAEKDDAADVDAAKSDWDESEGAQKRSRVM